MPADTPTPERVTLTGSGFERGASRVCISRWGAEEAIRELEQELHKEVEPLYMRIETVDTAIEVLPIEGM